MHDDLDLAVGRVKLKHGGSSGGHRGVSSCEYNLGTADFWRLRVGIGRPARQADVPDFVLEDFGRDAAAIDEKLRQVGGNLPLLLGGEAHEISPATSSAFLNALARTATAAAPAVVPAGRRKQQSAAGPSSAAPAAADAGDGSAAPAAAPPAAAPLAAAPADAAAGEPQPPPVRSGVSDLLGSLSAKDDGEAPPPKRTRSGS